MNTLVDYGRGEAVPNPTGASEILTGHEELAEIARAVEAARALLELIRAGCEEAHPLTNPLVRLIDLRRTVPPRPVASLSDLLAAS